jgi:hypothetical protein
MNVMLERCRLSGYSEARTLLREWIGELSFDLQEQIEHPETPAGMRVAAMGALDYYKDVAAQLQLY